MNYFFKTQKWAIAINYRMCQTTINCGIILQLENWFGNATASIFTFHLIIWWKLSLSSLSVKTKQPATSNRYTALTKNTLLILFIVKLIAFLQWNIWYRWHASTLCLFRHWFRIKWKVKASLQRRLLKLEHQWQHTQPLPHTLTFREPHSFHSDDSCNPH